MVQQFMKPTDYKLPTPSDLAMEQHLLGALLMYNEYVESVGSILKAYEFAEPLHSRIYSAILGAVNAGAVASPFTLKSEFENDPGMKSIGGASNYLAQLAVMSRDCLDPLVWAKQIHAFAFRREIIQAAQEIQAAATDASIEFGPEKIADYAESLLTAVTADCSTSGAERFKSLNDVAGGVLKSIGGDTVEKTIPFGISALDEATGGMRPGEFIVIGARPGMGKTAFAAHIAKSAAQAGNPVAFFSMEMGADAIALRLLTSLAFTRYRDQGGEWAVPDSVPAYEAARRRQLKPEQLNELFALEAKLAELPLKIHEGRGLTPNGIVLATKRLQNELKARGQSLGLVVVDHLQKIRPDRTLNGNKVGEMTEISNALQQLAGNMKLSVVGLSQLNRETEKRDNKKPQLGDLRESGAIEQDADLVLLLYREAYYVTKRQKHPSEHGYNEWLNDWLEWRHKLEIMIAKHRNGPEGRHDVFFHAPSSWIGDL